MSYLGLRTWDMCEMVNPSSMLPTVEIARINRKWLGFKTWDAMWTSPKCALFSARVGYKAGIWKLDMKILLVRDVMRKLYTTWCEKLILKTKMQLLNVLIAQCTCKTLKLDANSEFKLSVEIDIHLYAMKFTCTTNLNHNHCHIGQLQGLYAMRWYMIQD